MPGNHDVLDEWRATSPARKKGRGISTFGLKNGRLKRKRA
jgi:hypothetical protein